jgi:hypothetical protein
MSKCFLDVMLPKRGNLFSEIVTRQHRVADLGPIDTGHVT